MDESKLSAALGTKHVLPVEVSRFGWQSQLRFLESLGGKPVVRKAPGGEPYETDQGNWILDCAFAPIADPVSLAARLAARAGIIEHGLFCGIASQVIVAGERGSARSPARPDRLGPYEILSPLGAGGMGEVYRARDTRLGRDVAVKVLPERVSADADRLRRFEKEAQAASSLNHPNVVTIYDIGESNGTSYIAMELVDGARCASC